MRRVPRSVLVAAMLVGLVAVTYGSHVVHGGFYSDDWQLAADYRFSPAPRYVNAVRLEAHALGARPLLALAKPLPHALLGGHTYLHLALTLALGVLAALLFFLLLVRLVVPTLPAAAMAALAVLFPWSDSTKLWAVAGLNQLAMCAYFGGALLAVAGLRSGGRRGLALHAGALALYAAALLTYEAVAVLVLVTGLLYVFLGGRRVGGRRWAADVIVALALVLWARSRSSESLPAVRDMLSFSPHFAYQVARVALRAATPFPLVPLVTLALAIAAAVLLARRVASDGLDPVLRRWSSVAGLAALAGVAATLPFLGYLQPLASGVNNRGNIALAYPLAVLVVAGVVLLTIAVGRAARLPGAWLLPAALTLCGLVGVRYVSAARADVARWDRAALLQERVLAGVDRAVTHRRPDLTLYVYGYPADVYPGISVFSEPWDLDSAVRLAWGTRRVRAFPVVRGVAFVCGPTGVHPAVGHLPWDVLQGGYGPSEGSAYGRAVLVDAVRARSHVVAGAGDCRRRTAHLGLAPVAEHAG